VFHKDEGLEASQPASSTSIRYDTIENMNRTISGLMYRKANKVEIEDVFLKNILANIVHMEFDSGIWIRNV